ncbi:hypothetical protein EDD18DRAFT_1359213 [Armillaria luteobubalina]|uniref:XPG-I domain-containing protein n=1 Tax=Armillaria luteobubalina TaxID=153913 RepID=A0AA39TI06_9AGAR|nr:hypothetical protein EDD18DRAFT_1359213 [Armillaria luteobubalina]
MPGGCLQQNINLGRQRMLHKLLYSKDWGTFSTFLSSLYLFLIAQDALLTSWVLDEFGLDAPGEAEAKLTMLSIIDQINAMLSKDFDTMIFGTC